MGQDARLAAADVILDRGVRFKIPNAPLRLRLLGLNKITIKPLRAGTILENSRIILSSGLEKAIMLKDQAFLERSLDPVCEMVANAILNDERLIRLFSKKLKKVLLWKVPTSVIIEIFNHVSRLNRKDSFLNITRYFLTQTQAMMSPRIQNLGRDTKGS